MIWGQFIGDALCLGSHWIYNVGDIQAFFPQSTGFDVPRAGHYHEGKKAGDFTHYGEAALLLLESVAERNGLDVADYGRKFFQYFSSPAYRGYLDGATRGTLANVPLDGSGEAVAGFDFQAGAADDQLATATSLAPVVACYFGTPELAEQVGKATLVRQNHPRSVAYMQCYSQILSELLAGNDLATAVERARGRAADFGDFGDEIAACFHAVYAAKHLSTNEATAQLGQSCPIQGSFPAALVAVLQTPDDFSGTLLRVMAAGGDNAGRAAMAGAFLGAALGIDAIPLAMRETLTHHGRIAAALAAL